MVSFVHYLFKMKSIIQIEAQQSRNLARAIVEAVAVQEKGQLGSWVQSNAPEWMYVDLNIGNHQLRIGASTGGVISVDGDPFTPVERELIINKELTAQAIKYHIGLNKAKGHPDLKNPVRSLRCCCCGSYFEGRQFHNQDLGFGLGDCCVAFVQPRTEDMERTYGLPRVHYNT